MTAPTWSQITGADPSYGQRCLYSDDGAQAKHVGQDRIIKSDCRCGIRTLANKRSKLGMKIFNAESLEGPARFCQAMPHKLDSDRSTGAAQSWIDPGAKCAERQQNDACNLYGRVETTQRRWYKGPPYSGSYSMCALL